MSFLGAMSALLSEDSDDSFENKMNRALDNVENALKTGLDKAENHVNALDTAAVKASAAIDKTDAVSEAVQKEIGKYLDIK